MKKRSTPRANEASKKPAEAKGTEAAAKTVGLTESEEEDLAALDNLNLADPITVRLEDLEDTLIKDTKRTIRDSRRPAALVTNDETNIAGRFMCYNKGPMLEGSLLKKNSKDNEKQKKMIRLSVLHSIGLGTPLVINVDDADYIEICERFDEVEPDLMEAIIKRTIIKDKWYEKLIQEKDREDFKPNYFENVDNFFLILLTKKEGLSTSLRSQFTEFEIESNFQPRMC